MRVSKVEILSCVQSECIEKGYSQMMVVRLFHKREGLFLSVEYTDCFGKHITQDWKIIPVLDGYDFSY